METYQIRMKIDIVPCHQAPTEEPITQQDGSVQLTLSEEDAININRCEQALLKTVYPTLRATLSNPTWARCQKKATEHLTEGRGEQGDSEDTMIWAGLYEMLCENEQRRQTTRRGRHRYEFDVFQYRQNKILTKEADTSSIILFAACGKQGC